MMCTGNPIWLHSTEELPAQIAEKLNSGKDRQVPEQTVHHSLLRMGLCSRRRLKVPMLTPILGRKCLQWACECQNWTTEH